MLTIQERLDILQRETNIWAHGGWRTKTEILAEGKKLHAKEHKLCLSCGKKLDWHCKYTECLACREFARTSYKKPLTEEQKEYNRKYYASHKGLARP